MYNNLLIPIAEDHGTETDRVLAIAAALQGDGAAVTLLHVIEEIPQMALVHIPPEVLERSRTDAHDMLAGVAARFDGAPRTALQGGHGGRSIVDYAETHGIDCIVMRSHRPEFQDVFFGSTAAHVVRHAPCSVHVLR
ncbi:hypothetical protein LNKW23_27260 [Paralimibaculum aggregatum]|uniref:UspA domain-containing protein n=1 Tax=Paralimibaculum aggregatum TaxID=3036245 RepID=A0ABQ6LQQ8_9RHOB|nr:universal stress protein [Limibaculum sp. NKW23]GMG83513.1 hypothetical protein LNKW23_27260 [Limibaculum sp. NKW23]